MLLDPLENSSTQSGDPDRNLRKFWKHKAAVRMHSLLDRRRSMVVA
jgi:hypothetical protein